MYEACNLGLRWGWEAYAGAGAGDPCLQVSARLDVGRPSGREATPGDPTSDDNPETIANNMSIVVFALKAEIMCGGYD